MPLPPGRSGLPLVGETFSFLKNSFGFIESRVKEHGPIFRSSILGKPTVFLTGPEANELWVDEERIERTGSFPANIEQLFGGKSLPVLDGAAHRARKELVMAAFSRAALSAYVPVLSEITKASLARWAAAGEVHGLAEMKRLAIEGIARAVFGVTDDASVEAFLADYKTVVAGFAALPIPLPGTAYARALAARDRILARIGDLVRERRAKPGADGISRMVQATAKDGTKLDDEQAKLELHHVMLAGLIIFAEFGEMVLALTDHPKVREAVTKEASALIAKGAAPTLEDLAAADYLHRFVMEAKRSCPNVPISFGRAKRELEFQGSTIPAGWSVFMAVWQNGQASVFERPSVFDPDRYAAPRAEHQKHPHAYAPQGAGDGLKGHKCAGYDLSTAFMQIFAMLLVTGFDWDLPAQDRALRWDVLPPEPKGGLLLRLRARS